MEEYVIPVAPPAPQSDVTATLDDLQKHPQLYYQGADIVWMLICSALVFQMVLAMCLFYSGATARLSSLKLFRLPLITAAVVGFQWYLWGYTLAFTPAVPPVGGSGTSWYGGDSRGIALHDSTGRPVGFDGPKIPELVYELYESMFASFTAALVCGGAVRYDDANKFPSGDVPVGRFLIFISLWSLLVYNPVARWTWHWAGWSNQKGVLDFAGGTPVHITSGTTVLAFYIFYAIQTNSSTLFRRKSTRQGETTNVHPSTQHTATSVAGTGYPQLPRRHSLVKRKRSEHEEPVATEAQPNNNPLDVEAGHGPEVPVSNDQAPHNVNNVVFGTALLWIGWFGFNGGSALGGNLRAVSACVATHVAACAGGTCMLFLFWATNYGSGETQAISITHFCDGAVIALVAITPGAGFVPVWSAGLFGIISTVVIFLVKKGTGRYLHDSPLYIFTIHAGGGFVGMILTGAFASADIAGLDGYSTIPDRSRAAQVGWQIADALAGFLYTLCMTLLILWGLKLLRSLLRFRPSTGFVWSAGFEKPLKPGQERLEPRVQHDWTGDLEAEGQGGRGTDPPEAILMQSLPR